jgi:two-component system CheB/CheR fusion protein
MSKDPVDRNGRTDELGGRDLRIVAPRNIVGIGASAGGLDPLVRFFDNLPKDTGMAFVIVQHLSPDFKSLMDELLGRHTVLPIHLVEDGMPVEADHVYLIPAKKEMIISGGRLLLSERDRQQELTLPIDMFFRSLAQDCGERAIAIVLSGGGSDGSRGICHVREAGGLVLAQDLDSAQFDGMPRAAVESGAVNLTVPPEDMPRVLLAHAHNRVTAPPGESAAQPPARGLEAVYRMLEAEFGIDFNHYKPSTVTRRIERRLALAQSPNVDEYLQRLRVERDELDALYRDLLIGVTRFFRDAEAFRLLEERVLPELLEREPRSSPLRFWVAGCATGEEAYSLAILMQDLMAVHGERPVKIFATDVHRGSLDRAALAAYDDEAVAGVSPERLARYFTHTGGAYQVIPELRQMIVFAQHNVITDAPFTRLDLITCRNLLIYLQPPAQQRILSFFHFALNQNGVLFLGPSESLGPVADGFETLDKHWQVYRKAGEVRTPVDARHPAPLAVESRFAPPQVSPPRHSLGQLLSVYDALLEECMPPSLILNERGEVAHVLGGAARFLRVRDGRQSLDVRDLVDADLKMILSGGARRALAERSPVVFNGVRTQADDQLYRVTIRAVAGRAAGARHVVASFESPIPDRRAGRSPSPPIHIDVDQVSRQQLAALEAELGTTKESLQAAIEQLEASNEELQASNEELQASNEELQSTNEELQSVNEELYTVNAEYQRKIAELTELTNDMDNLLASTDVGTIFLDGQLRIRKFTPQVAETFGLVPHDVGRQIETFAHKMRHPELADELRHVLASGAPIERDLVDLNGKSYFLRLLPYRAKGSADGVVLTLIDVSGLKAAEDALFHERYLLNSLLGTVPDAIYFKDARGRFIRLNRAMAERLGLGDPAEAIGKTAFDLPDQDAAMALHREDAAVLRSGEPQHYRLERRAAAGGAEAWDMVTRLPLVDRDRKIVGIIAIFRDVSEQVRSKAKIDDEVRRRDEFLAMLSHELRNPLGAMVTATAMLKDAGADLEARSVEILERQSRQMARLLDDLLEASRVTQNKIALRRRVVDLRAIAAEAAEAVRSAMAEKGLHFSVELVPDPIWVDGDAARLQQVQINLLSNAYKYTPRGGRVSLRVGADESGARIAVSDSGAGIPRAMIDSVFDLFVQGKQTLDHANGGLGVGLTLVRALVELHGGSVAARSDGQGKGSEFVVRLPVANRPASAPDVDDAAAPALPAQLTVLIVEDNADSREMLCAILARAGLMCHGAADGHEALAMIEQFNPDIAILDVGLPGIDGLETARRIRANPRHQHIRLIALTGYGRATDKEATREAGFDYHLTKPVQPEDLLSLLARASVGAVDRPARRGVVEPDVRIADGRVGDADIEDLPGYRHRG